ncbi:MAG: hypothetical protein ACREO3_12470 [Arenimonas sp.]
MARTPPTRNANPPPTRPAVRALHVGTFVALVAVAACSSPGEDEARGGVQSAPSTVSAHSAPPAPFVPAPLPDYTGTPCAVLAQIQNPPTLIGRPVVDPAYASLKKSGTGAIPCLVMALSDPRPLAHPQKLPGTQVDFSVGDLAFFLLIDFDHVDFMRALPPDVGAKVPTRGAFAYFDWIVVPGSREQLQARVREQLAMPMASAPDNQAPLKR